MADDEEFSRTIKLLHRVKLFCRDMPVTEDGMREWAKTADQIHLNLKNGSYSTSFLKTLESVSELHAAIVGRN